METIKEIALAKVESGHNKGFAKGLMENRKELMELPKNELVDLIRELDWNLFVVCGDNKELYNERLEHVFEYLTDKF